MVGFVGNANSLFFFMFTLYLTFFINAVPSLSSSADYDNFILHLNNAKKKRQVNGDGVG